MSFCQSDRFEKQQSLPLIGIDVRCTERLFNDWQGIFRPTAMKDRTDFQIHRQGLEVFFM